MKHASVLITIMLTTLLATAASAFEPDPRGSRIASGGETSRQYPEGQMFPHLPIANAPPDKGNIIVEPQGDCPQTRAVLQAALDMAPVNISLTRGVFCIDQPLIVHSSTTISGVQANGELFSVIQQRKPATSIFHLSKVWGVEIAHIKLELNPNIASSEGVSCELDPWNPGLCLWRRGSGIAAYDTRGITVRGVHITGGTYGIALLDQPLLERPLHGPQASFSLRNNANILRIEDDPCSTGRGNLSWIIEDNVIEEARDGLLVLNLSHSNVERNTIRDSKKFNGIKIGCGPVENNRVAANYLAHNGVNNLGDGIDVAWGWKIRSEERSEEITDQPANHNNQTTKRCLETIEDAPDGVFRNNTFTANLIWGNGANGIAIKTSPAQQENDCDGDPFDLPAEPPGDIMKLARNDIIGNIIWGNGVGNAQCNQGNCPFSQLELRRLLPPLLETPDGKMRVIGNVLAAAPEVPANGAFLHKIYAMEYIGNWHRGSVPGGKLRDIWSIEGSQCTITNTAFLWNFADQDDLDLPQGGNCSLLQASALPAWDFAYDWLVNAIVASHPYHLEDSDGDGCPNAREVLAGADHLDPLNVPGSCP